MYEDQRTEEGTSRSPQPPHGGDAGTRGPGAHGSSPCRRVAVSPCPRADGPLALIVEDNPTNRLLARAVLRRAGYSTEEAGSAEEARARLQQCRPDVILMDLELPGEDGLTLTRALKAGPATAAIPVVALTAHAMRGDAEQALAAGFDGYIAKPINTRTFAAQLAAILNPTADDRTTRPLEHPNT